MVDPRIYRVCWLLVAVAVILFGFSLQPRPAALSSTIMPGPSFGNTGTTIKHLEAQFPSRSAGSSGDSQLASWVANQIHGDSGFEVSTDSFRARTSQGMRTLENVVATKPGLEAGSVVVVSQRDSSVDGNATGLSGTAVMVELADALSAQTLNRSVTLISTSGQIGAAGVTRIAHEFSRGSVDAVIVLGDLASRSVRQPIVVPFSDGDDVAPTALTRTLASAITAQTGLQNRQTKFGGQLLRLAFPYTATGQAPFADRSIPAVLVSLAGDRPTSGVGAGVVPGAVNGALAGKLGVAVFGSVEALDRGQALPAPAPVLVLSGHIVPAWAVRLLVLTLILPVACSLLDGIARLRRQGHAPLRWVIWVLSSAVPFVIGYIALLLARLTGLLNVTTPGAVGAGEVPAGATGLVVLIAVLIVIVLAFVLLRPRCLRLAATMKSGRVPQSPAANAAAVALSAVMTVTALVIWIVNPLSAVLVLLPLHLWLWFGEPAIRSRRALTLPAIVVAVLPAFVVLFYYHSLLGLSVGQLLWSGALMLAGGTMSPLAAFYWSVMCGSVFAAVVLAVRGGRAGSVARDTEITVRGPVTYAGPGSLGGTESALRH
jgi:hypothetical protein